MLETSESIYHTHTNMELHMELDLRVSRSPTKAGRYVGIANHQPDDVWTTLVSAHN